MRSWHRVVLCGESAPKSPRRIANFDPFCLIPLDIIRQWRVVAFSGGIFPVLPLSRRSTKGRRPHDRARAGPAAEVRTGTAQADHRQSATGLLAHPNWISTELRLDFCRTNIFCRGRIASLVNVRPPSPVDFEGDTHRRLAHRTHEWQERRDRSHFAAHERERIGVGISAENCVRLGPCLAQRRLAITDPDSRCGFASLRTSRPWSTYLTVVFLCPTGFLLKPGR